MDVYLEQADHAGQVRSVESCVLVGKRHIVKPVGQAGRKVCAYSVNVVVDHVVVDGELRALVRWPCQSPVALIVCATSGFRARLPT